MDDPELKRRFLAKERQRRYYERNSDLIKERRKERYDPEIQAQHYQEHRDAIRMRQRNNYIQQKKAANIERLNGLLTICPAHLQVIIEKMIEGVREEVVRESDVIGIEKAVLMCAMRSNNEASDSKVDE